MKGKNLEEKLLNLFACYYPGASSNMVKPVLDCLLQSKPEQGGNISTHLQKMT